MFKLSEAPDISIILPALSLSEEYLRCLHSIRAALMGKVKYEIISVVRDKATFESLAERDLLLLPEEGPGIYRAMNSGIQNATGEYIYFIGQDDILLPGAAKAILLGLDKESDIILGDVFWGDRYIHRNYARKHFLVWSNWCHQGAFYRRKAFLEKVRSFPLEYKAQADHYSNILLRTDRAIKVDRYEGCVAWYSATGFSTQSPDRIFREAFPRLVRMHFGLISYSAVILRRALLKCIRFVGKA